MHESMAWTGLTRTDVERELRLVNIANAVHAAAFLTIGISTVSWVVTLQQVNVMPPLPSTGDNTSLGVFTVWWVGMFAAMMLPGAAPAVFRVARTSRSVRAVSLFVGSYVAIWSLVGTAMYVICLVLPVHGTPAAAGAAIVAGVYELTPLKRRFRRRCLESSRSGLEFGFHCVGSNLCLMLLPPLGVMNIAWMLIISVICIGQKIWPAKALFELPLAVVVLGLGVALLVRPASVPGLLLPM